MKKIEKVVWVECSGEAHKPEVGGMIDNCGVCMPFWGRYPTCPVHKTGVDNKGWCKTCRTHYKLSE